MFLCSCECSYCPSQPVSPSLPSLVLRYLSHPLFVSPPLTLCLYLPLSVCPSVRPALPPYLQASLCYSGSLDSSKCSGKIVVCDRGEVLFTDKIAEVQSTGASGLIITNVQGGTSGQFALSDTFPVAHVDVSDGVAIKSYISSSGS